jgi:beta-phosphoglucomutase-like phosphatase (HAD superfamily)
MSGAGRSRTSGAGMLFDVDGVLVHSAEPVRRSWRRWASERGLPERAVLEFSHGRRTVDTVRALAPQIDAGPEAARLEAEQSEDTDGVTAGAGAAGLLASLPPGSWAVVTSCTRGLALARLTAAGLPPPPSLVSAEDVAEGKPSPEGYLLGARRIGLPPDECVVFEDAAAGIEAGHAAGMSVVAVAGLRLPGELASADLVVNELTEVRVSQQSTGRLLISIGRPAGERGRGAAAEVPRRGRW